MLATGGSEGFPTPLPSVLLDTLAAWGASNPPPRPCTQVNRKVAQAPGTHATRLHTGKTRKERVSYVCNLSYYLLVSYVREVSYDAGGSGG